MRASLHLGLLLLPLLTGCVAAAPDSEEAETVGDDSFGVKSCPMGATVKGVDVSFYQGAIDWAAVKGSGVRFGIARVSDGNQYLDDRFSENWKKMKSAGVIRGAYQFFRPGQSASSQAKVFLDMLEDAGGLQDGDLPPTLDIEVTDGVSASTLVSRAKAWISTVKEATGRTPMIYTSPGFWSQIGNPSGFGQSPLWVAHWGVSCPSIPAKPWTDWSFWQRTDKGSVPGISGDVDVNHFNGSLAELQRFAETPRGGGPVVSSWAAGRLDVFARSGGDRLVHRWYENGSWSSGWEDLGGKLTSEPAVVSWADGRIDVFARGTGKDLIHKWYAKGDGWSGWERLGGDLASTPAVSSWASGRLDVFARGEDSGLLHRSFERGVGWSGWTNLGGAIASRPAAVSRGEGRIDVVANAEGGDLVHASFEEGAGWSDWEHLGGDLTSVPTIASWESDRLDVFARGQGDKLARLTYTSAGGWGEWKAMAGSLRSSPAAISWAPGRIDLFARGGAGDKLVHRWYDGSWHDWETLGSMP